MTPEKTVTVTLTHREHEALKELVDSIAAWAPEFSIWERIQDRLAEATACPGCKRSAQYLADFGHIAGCALAARAGDKEGTR